MHPLQAAFFKAILDWDGFKMGELLIQIIELINTSQCSEKARTQIVWYCREFLEGMEGHPNQGMTMPIPETPYTLNLSAPFQK